MKNISNIFLKKKILVYGLGKSGLSTLKFLQNKCEIYAYDDSIKKVEFPKIKKKIIKFNKISKLKFDKIILSPGIDINNCKLSSFLKKNRERIHTDFDVFFSFYRNDCITITGTNGKSTTCQILYEVLKKQKFDVRLVGNIGTPILSVKNINKKTLFVIEASSYQLEYSKIFKSNYAVILNISPDHIERHKTLNQYTKAKFKLLKSQIKGDLAFVKKSDKLINKELKLCNFKSKIIKVNTKSREKFFKKIHNRYFLNETNKENLSFVYQISKKLNLNKKLILDVIEKFKGLKYRQQIIYNRNKLTIINDSKSTSFSSTIGVLKANESIYWLLGGIPKKGDKFTLPKKYFSKIRAFVYGKNYLFFNRQLKNKIKFENFKNLKIALKKIFLLLHKEKSINKIILFSPCAASFDSFRNFEDRGMYFNKLVEDYFDAR
ncbi:UDP-N-acetylmuramoyl-L-alanine--D-glutamate ligase [Candidatus Pelagibacter sp.]|nr:UDP-N-acetylmuramoyl-L-alanine--D-glutamate ligase [Candidatus Pelagibacter sp.]